MPLFWISLVFISGIFIGSWLDWTWKPWLVVGSVFLLFFIALRLFVRWRPQAYGLAEFEERLQIRFYRRSVPLVLLLVTLCFGAARYQFAQPTSSPASVAWYSDQPDEVSITGVIIALPDQRDTYVNLRVQTEQLTFTQPETINSDVNQSEARSVIVKGVILARVPVGKQWHYGDRITLHGLLETPPEDEDFSYRDYLAGQGIYAYMPWAKASWQQSGQGNFILQMIYKVNEKWSEILYQIFPDPEASLLAGILLGNDNGISVELQQDFKDTGTSHIIAISGFNIAIIAGIFAIFFNNLLGYRKGTLFALAGIIFYTILVGGGASVVRAAVMGGLSLFAHIIGRRQMGYHALAITAAVMCLFNPLLPWDVSFQLSFLATLGLMIYGSRFQEACVRFSERFLPSETARKIPGPIAEYFLLTIAAQLTTLPIMAYHFGRISLISILANPAILPVQPLVMILGGLAVIFGWIYLPLGQIVAWLAYPLVAFTIRIVELFSNIPHSVLVLGQFSFLFVVVCYGVIFLLTFAPHRIVMLKNIITPTMGLIVLILITAFVWRLALYAPDGLLHLSFFDVGSADAILIQSPGGRFVLVNGGPRASVLSDALGRRLPPFHHRLDWLLIASGIENQIAALPRTITRYPVDGVIWAGKPKAGFASRQLNEYFTESETSVIMAETGMSLDLGDSASLELINVDESGAILLLRWKKFRALLPVGINSKSLDILDNGRNIGPVNLLLLAQSGADPLTPTEWIWNLNPQFIVVNVSASDLSHPGIDTLKAIQGYPVLRTDQEGWIEITTDGVEAWIQVERK